MGFEQLSSRRFHNGVMFSLDRSTSLPMSMVQKKPAPGGTVQHCRKLISPLKGKQKEKAISVNEVKTMSKFPKAYSLTGEQIPAATFQLWRCRELTPSCMCTGVNRPCYKPKADKYDQLKQFHRETMVKHSRVSINELFVRPEKILQQVEKTGFKTLRAESGA